MILSITIKNMTLSIQLYDTQHSNKNMTLCIMRFSITMKVSHSV
jgi:hypothetical protein